MHKVKLIMYGLEWFFWFTVSIHFLKAFFLDSYGSKSYKLIYKIENDVTIIIIAALLSAFPLIT